MLMTSVDDAVLVGVDDGLDAVAELELSENPCDVRLYGGLAYVYLPGNLDVGQAARDQFEYFEFALGEVGQLRGWLRRGGGAGEFLDHPAGDGWV